MKPYRFIKLHLKIIVPIIDFLGGLFFFWKKAISIPQEINSILLIKLNNIGDTLPLITMANVLKHYYPQAKIDYLVRPTCTDISSFSKNINTVFTINPFEMVREHEKKVSLKEQFLLIKKLRQKTYDVIFDVRGDLRNSFLGYFLKKRFFVGYGDGGGGFLQNRTLFPEKEWDFIERDVFLITQIQKQTPNLKKIITREIRLDIPEYEVKVIQKFLKRQKIEKKELIIIHPGAGLKEKELKYADILKHLKNLNPTKTTPIILVGMLKDKKRLEQYGNQLTDYSKLYIITPKKLTILAALIAQCSIIICADSAPMHFGGYLHKKVLPTFYIKKNYSQHVKFWFPYKKSFAIRDSI